MVQIKASGMMSMCVYVNNWPEDSIYRGFYIQSDSLEFGCKHIYTFYTLVRFTLGSETFPNIFYVKVF